MSTPLHPDFVMFCRAVGRIRCSGLFRDILVVDGFLRLVGMDIRRCPTEHHNDNHFR